MGHLPQLQRINVGGSEMNQKCETCLNSRVVVSENGAHCVCCLGKNLAFLCMIGKVDRHTTPPKEADEPTEAVK